MPGLRTFEIYVLGTILAMSGGVMAAFSTGPGGFTQTPQEAADSAHVGPRLVVLETSSCGWCRKLRKDLGPEYQGSSYNDRARLTDVSLNSWAQGKLKLREPVMATPTLVLVDGNGVELSRHTGYPGDIYPMYDMVERHVRG